MEGGAEIKEADVPDCVPTIYGERHRPLQKGSLSNLSSENLNIAAIFRAFSAGLVKNVTTMLSCQDLIDNGIQTLICSGSLISRNRWVREAIESCYRELDIQYGDSCDSALGAGIVAARGLTAVTKTNESKSDIDNEVS